MAVYERQSRMPVTVGELAAWHARPGSFERLCLPWLKAHISPRSGDLRAGERLTLSVDIGPLRRRWSADIVACEPGRLVDVQVDGPFTHWRHTQEYLPDAGGSILKDRVDYRLPLARAGEILGEGPARAGIGRLFRFRHRRTRDDLERHAAYAPLARRTVAVTGSSGLIGRELVAFLTSGGHRVLRLVRTRPAGEDEIFWDPQRCALDGRRLAGVDAVVHLAGVTLDQRWTPEAKRAIAESRIDGTDLIARTVTALDPPPLLISASAIGYYGSRGIEAVDESSPRGVGFLADLVTAWEAALEPARRSGVHVVAVRSGLVLSGRGGALGRMLPGYRYGLAGTVGSGRRWISWIALEDYLGLVLRLLYEPSPPPVINAVSPQAVTSADFARTLSRVLRRPSLVPLPARAVKLVFGEMGETLLLDSLRVVPVKLQEMAFDFRYPDLEAALRAELGLLGD